MLIELGIVTKMNASEAAAIQCICTIMKDEMACKIVLCSNIFTTYNTKERLCTTMEWTVGSLHWGNLVLSAAATLHQIYVQANGTIIHIVC